MLPYFYDSQSLWMTGALNFDSAVTLASATTTDLGSAKSNYVIVSGTTTITGLGTSRQGVVRFVRFSGALTLTHNGTSLILPTAANITTAAGDTALFISEGTGNWRCLFYSRANGLPLPIATTANYRAATANTVLESANVWTAAGIVALTDAATIAVDLSTGLNFSVTLGGNRTLGAPSNVKAGQSGCFLISQDATGSRTLAFNAVYKFAGGTAFAIDSTASRLSVISYFVQDSSNIVLSGLAGVR